MLTAFLRSARALGFSMIVLLVLVGFARAGSSGASTALIERGARLVGENCAQCHAVGREGGSDHPDAPAFRDLGKAYPVSDLAESLAEGIVTNHPDMPVFEFERQDVEAIIVYLESIQTN